MTGAVLHSIVDTSTRTARTVRILQGDVFAALAKLPDDHFDCVVTSPPYWGLRDYGVDGQLGLERTLGEHIDVMVRVFREVRRVLKPTGTLWLNYGDCYAAWPNGRSATDTKLLGKDDRTFRDKPFSTVGPIYEPKAELTPRTDLANFGSTAASHGGRILAGGTLKPKDLCMVPNRLAIALQDDGWWVRSEIIWHKPNPMPESIKDRPGSSHEKIFLLSKSERYFYDSDAVREKAIYKAGEGGHQRFGAPNGKAAKSDYSERLSGEIWNSDGFRNLRNVWTIPTAAFSEAHFATFPPELVERCLKAGCPVGGHALDPFGGSGTTALVADGLGMNCTLIELNPAYVEIARKRLDDMFRTVNVESA